MKGNITKKRSERSKRKRVDKGVSINLDDVNDNMDVSQDNAVTLSQRISSLGSPPYQSTPTLVAAGMAEIAQHWPRKPKDNSSNE